MDGVDGESFSAALEYQEELLQSHSDVPKQPYRSFKKKYRKMRIKFDDVMRQSNALFTEEQSADETAKRLAQENDQILELLLDINNSAQIPVDKRIDLSIGTPALAHVPALVSTEDLAKAAENTSPAGQAVYSEICDLLKEKESQATKPSKSLAQLMSTVPHLSLKNSQVSPDLLASLEAPAGKTSPISYISPDRIDEYLYEIDAINGIASAQRNVVYPTSSQEIYLKNPHSVLNWLRTHEPKIFLQDGEGDGPQKGNSKPGALRGAGKRAVIPTPTQLESLEIVEEDGLGYDASLGGLSSGKSKRKRDEGDDGGYTPKSGNPINKVKRSRPSKRKSDAGETPASASSKKGKGKARNSSSSPSGPAPHPFGPIS